MAFSKESLQKDILIQLGKEFVDVELKSEALDYVVRTSLEQLEKYKPLIRIESYKVASGMQEYVLPADVKGVTSMDLIPGIKLSLVGGYNIEAALLSGFPVYYGVGEVGIDISYLDLRLRWLKTLSRELAADPDKEVFFDTTDNRWKIYTYATSELLVTARTVISYDPELSNIPIHNQKWLRDWALTEAKLILANIRGKYDKVPVAGTSLTLNAGQLRSEAKAEQDELLKQIQSSRADLVPRYA